MACNHIDTINVSIRSLKCTLDMITNKIVSVYLGFNHNSNGIDSNVITMEPGLSNKKDNKTSYNWFSKTNMSEGDIKGDEINIDHLIFSFIEFRSSSLIINAMETIFEVTGMLIYLFYLLILYHI